MKNSQEVVTSRFSRRTDAAESLSMKKGSMKNILTSDMESEYSPEKKGATLKSPNKLGRRGTLLGGKGRMKQSHEGGQGEDGRRSSMMSVDS